MDIVIAVLALILGGVVGYMMAYRKMVAVKSQLAECSTSEAVVRAQLQNKVTENDRLAKEKEELLLEVKRNAADLATLSTQNKTLNEQLRNKVLEIEELQKRLTTEFENIANRLLKERSQEFAQSNEKNLGQIINPLKEKIASFEKQVREAYDLEVRDKISLKAEVKKLTELNAKVSEEANNLTRALKGDVKKQGNWGEVILERVLENSGLTKGREYEVQVPQLNDEGGRQMLDVVVFLPDSKHVIIDSKVSLVAYEQMVSSDLEEEILKYKKQHVESVRAHVNILSAKKYQSATTLNTPDFVLMFIPIEGSFSAAMQGDTDLFSYAWDRKIVIVSPTTLLATLRTIASIWKQENQTRNAMEIAAASGRLYDKLVGVVADLDMVRKSIQKAGESYDTAMSKMKEGRGNVFSIAETIKQLGAKTQKSLPADYIGE